MAITTIEMTGPTANLSAKITPKENVICVSKDAYDIIEELRRNNYDKNINK